VLVIYQEVHHSLRPFLGKFHVELTRPHIIGVTLDHSRRVGVFVHEGSHDSEFLLVFALNFVLLDLELDIKKSAVLRGPHLDRHDDKQRRCRYDACGSRRLRCGSGSRLFFSPKR